MANTIAPINLPTQMQMPQIADRARGPEANRSHAVADDSLELRRHSPQQVLNQQIMKAIGGLNDFLKTEGFQTIEQLNPADYTAEKVSDRILNFIDMGLKRAEANGADSDELQRLREQARAGVEDGYKKAYDMLQGLGIMDGEVKAGVEKTYELLQQGLDRMDQGLPLMASAGQSEEMLALSGRSEERSLSLQIQTRDGDTISINLQRNSSIGSASYDSQNADGQRSIRLEQRNSEFNFSYQVDGSLDQEEENAIKDLLRGIDRFADDFFSGSTSRSLQDLLSGGFDGNELSSFNLQMSQTQTSYAARAYQNIDRMDRSAGQETERSMPRGQLLQQLRDLDQGPGLALGKRFENPSDLMRQLLGQRLELDPRFDARFGSDPGDQTESPASLTDQLMEAANRGDSNQE
jgi:hypothetical protein